MTEQHSTCAECDELFLEYFEGDLDTARRSMVEAHASSCARCQGLIRDLRGITEAAAALPVLEPSRDLWKGIEERIEPAVVPISYRRDGIHLSRRVIGLAAAALIVVSSSVTYVATQRTAKRPQRVVTAPGAFVPGQSDEIGTQPTPPAEVSPAPETTTPEVSAPPAREVKPAPRTRPSVGGNAPAASRGTALAANRPQPQSAAEAALAPEIAQLQDVLKQRRNQLDPSTIKVVEDNLALIDAAVKQARAALLRDPASGFLTERLDNALQKKVELLRTVALMPSRS
jgi:hypothetical protein